MSDFEFKTVSTSLSCNGQKTAPCPEVQIAEAFEYDVFESFHSWQGEGVHAGRSAFFIRLAGCPIRCPWCDSAAAWNSECEHSRTNVAAESLAETAKKTNPDFIVITGGEPTIHNLVPLCNALHARNLRVHLETCGAFPIRGNVDWVTLSPKVNRLPISENWTRAAEFKWIITCPEDLIFWAEKTSQECISSEAPISLHPEWSQRENPEVLNAISNWICSHGFPYRAGWQLHKLFNVR